LLDRWNSKSDGRVEILGLYRRCTRNEATLSQDDVAALNAIPTQAPSIFLLIEPRAARSNMHLFLTRRGAILSKWNLTPFSGRFAGSRTTRQSEQLVSSLEKLGIPVSEPKEVGVSRDPWRSQKWQWQLSALAIVALLMLGVFWSRSRSGLNLFAKDTSVALRLAREGTDWRLSWNPYAPILQEATKGHLLITDGPFHKNLDLDISDLRGGAVVYSAATNDIVFRLEVDTKDSENSVSESVRTAAGLISPGFEPTKVPHKRVVHSHDSQIGNRQPNYYHIRSARLSEPEVVVRPDIPAARQIETERDPIPSSSFSDPISRMPLKTPQTDLPRLPITAKEIEADSPITTVSPSQVSATSSPQASLPSASAAVPTVVSEEPLKAPSLLEPPRDGRLEPARLILRREPIYPKVANGWGGSVKLQFLISNAGIVRDVRVIKGNPVLGRAALEAVQMWRYHPARLNGNPIETEGFAVINFDPHESSQ
jgi:protein TonB